MDGLLIVEWIIEALLIIVVLLVGVLYLTLYERKALARIQVRIGPNRAGPLGLMQPFADAMKLIFKEELTPKGAYKFIFVLAPIITVIPMLVILAVVPWGGSANILGREIGLYLADVNVGVLFILSITSISVYGIVMAGWASNNKYAMMGGLRSSAQMISYELSLGLAFVSPVLIAGSLSLGDIVDAQNPIWFIVYQPLGALIFFIAGLAELNRSPFDMPEAEQELVAGYHVEYSGMKFALFYMAEYGKMIVVAFIFATLFLGGYRGPFIDQVPALGPLYVLVKVFLILFVMIWIRGTWPRIRYDRLMAFGWKVMLPLALLNVLLTAVILVLIGG